MNTDYTPNSHKYKEEQATNATRKKVDKVVKGRVKTRKKSELVKLKDAFISEDASSVKSYILNDLIIPTVKRTIVDAIKNSAEMIFLGRITGNSTTGSNHIRYSEFSRRNNTSRGTRMVGYDFEDVVFEYKEDAEEVLQRMDDLIETVGLVSVADYLDLAGETCTFTDNNYGWTSLRTARIVRVGADGFAIDLPKAMPIN